MHCKHCGLPRDENYCWRCGPTTEDMTMPQEHIEQFFAYAHLPASLQAVSLPFAKLAEHIIAELPRNPERTVALRKLLEAKDAAVRAALAQG